MAHYGAAHASGSGHRRAKEQEEEVLEEPWTVSDAQASCDSTWPYTNLQTVKMAVASLPNLPKVP